jgi:hypothetical protein
MTVPENGAITSVIAEMIPYAMASLAVEGNELVVQLSRWERAAALHGDVRVPLAAVRSVRADRDPWSALRGIRAPGTGWPRAIAYGVWRLTGGRPDFAAVLRGRPTVVVELDPPSRFGRLLVSVSDAEITVASVRAAAGL